jgi:hypothetical protein
MENDPANYAGGAKGRAKLGGRLRAKPDNSRAC